MEDLLTKLAEQAMTSVSQKDYTQGLSCLRKVEDILEDSATQGLGSFEFVLFTLHNLAYCYQQLGQIDECASYLDGCAFNVSNRLKANSRKNSSLQIHLRLYLSQANIQLGNALASLNKHELAEYRCDVAVKQLLALVKICSKRCAQGASSSALSDPATKSKSFGSLSAPGKSPIPSYLRIATSSFSRLERLLDLKLDCKYEKRPGKETYNWTTRLCTWQDIVQVKPMNADFFQGVKTSLELLQTDFVSQVMSLSAAALYLLASEKRAIVSSEKDGKRIHRRAILILQDLPDSSLSQYIIKTFQNTYAVLNTSTESAKSNPSRRPSHSPARKSTGKSAGKAKKMTRAKSTAPKTSENHQPKTVHKETVSFPVSSAELETKLREVQKKTVSAEPKLPVLSVG